MEHPAELDALIEFLDAAGDQDAVLFMGRAWSKMLGKDVKPGIGATKPMGDLGVINPMAMSIRNLDEIETAVAGSNVVINLLGKHFETRRAPA